VDGSGGGPWFVSILENITGIFRLLVDPARDDGRFWVGVR
jgi:hypothetical protein